MAKKRVAEVGGLMALAALAFIWIQQVRRHGLNWPLFEIPRYLERRRGRQEVHLPYFLNLVEDRTPSIRDLEGAERAMRIYLRAVSRGDMPLADRALTKFYQQIAPVVDMNELQISHRQFLVDVRLAITQFLENPSFVSTKLTKWAVFWSEDQFLLPPEDMVIADSLVEAVRQYMKQFSPKERLWAKPREADRVHALLNRVPDVLEVAVAEDRMVLLNDLREYIATPQDRVA